MSDGELSLIYVQDLVRALVEAAVRFPRKEDILFVSDGKAYAWDDVASMRHADTKGSREKPCHPRIVVCRGRVRFGGPCVVRFRCPIDRQAKTD